MSQSTTDTTTASAFRQPLPSHLHIDNEICPWCEQVIPPEKLEEIGGKIAAKEREQAQAITAKLEQQHALDKAQADAKAKADLALERQQSTAREAAAREEARQAAEAAAALKLTEAERIRQEQQAGLQQKVEAAEGARIAAEQAGVSLQTQLQQQLQDSEAALAAAKADATAREADIRTEALSAAQAELAEKLATAESARQQSEAVLQARIAEIEATKTAAEQKGDQLQVQLDELRKAKDGELAKVKEDAVAEAARIRQQAAEAAKSSVRDKLAEKDNAVIEAQAKSAEAEGKLAQLSEQHERALKQQLDSQREILENDKEQALNTEKARAFEETQKLSNKVTELQRALEKKTADELGEGAEVNLYEALKAQFPDDRIDRIVKGTPGADIHHVVLYNRRTCGTIIYDSKNHGQFRTDHVTKLRADQLAAKADHAILSTRKFPAKTGQLHIEGGVLLANPARVVTLVTLLRQHLIHLHTLRISSAERENKTAALYDFITSDHCTQFLSRIDANAQGLLDLQMKAKKFHDKAWEKEGVLIKQIQKAQADFSNEICRIIGTAAEDAALEDVEL
jgi:hypothetical protein